MQVQFQEVVFSTIDRSGKTWLSSKDIALALYPYKGGPQSEAPFEKRLRNLYSRHVEEFTPSMTALIDVQTAGGMQQVRVFSLRGAHLLGMLARSERAKEFRRWVLDVLEARQENQHAALTEYHKALELFAHGQASASVCGRRLNAWKKDKPKLETRLMQIMRKLQPDLLRQTI